MAMIVEQAGGRASDGYQDLLDIAPETLHERTPLYMGSRDFVKLAEKYLAEGD
jgi:fructose-1,6-bisphosphatase I